MQKEFDVAVVGAGIVGLAVALAAARTGKKVVVFERNSRAIGASIRNFGLIWPIGQQPGPCLDRALRSREIWKEVSAEANIWLKQNGSLHLAYHQDELAVLEEFMQQTQNTAYECQLLSAEEVAARSPGVKTQGLLAGLWSATEMTVDPREAIRKLPEYLSQKYGVSFYFDTAINAIDQHTLSANQKSFSAKKIYVCSGSDFETLYPEVFAETKITKCKLQMMRTATQPQGWDLGPTLCGGLTLRHYAAFQSCPSLSALSQRYDEENPAFAQWHIHVMMSQNGLGELVIGDSHEYGKTLEPFDKEEINQHILNYLHTFAQAPSLEIAERWHGIYPKLPGKTELIAHPTEVVTIVNALSGAGMSLSFGLGEEVVAATL
ncbi:TIGR03364 family FAD-dependent oxidoreductase [Porifericola rhodea]|uniref:TIGR03364 family FAD-dependent oxidoreductase n=1 Tax=Porifericola rhodea TaxID=930972 RepID=UPI002665CE60|nr:TIGR03364 family FAD-dependent oxidoreductase [Porifericola rhodea]WKN29877.1 TIGR03364 family FAD-dependent oxidoreductase [Porifericola rhodea]